MHHLSAFVQRLDHQQLGSLRPHAAHADKLRLQRHLLDLYDLQMLQAFGGGPIGRRRLQRKLQARSFQPVPWQQLPEHRFHLQKIHELLWTALPKRPKTRPVVEWVHQEKRNKFPHQFLA